MEFLSNLFNPAGALGGTSSASSGNDGSGRTTSLGSVSINAGGNFWLKIGVLTVLAILIIKKVK